MNERLFTKQHPDQLLIWIYIMIDFFGMIQDSQVRWPEDSGLDTFAQRWSIFE